MVEKPPSPGSYVLGIESSNPATVMVAWCDNAAKFRDPLAGPGAVSSGARHIPPRLSGYRKRLVALSFGREISVPRVAPGARSKREWGAATGVGMLV
jgi:hypothetical protein